MLNHLLTPYLYDDQLRPALSVPFANETHTFATDAVSFIRIPNNLIENPPLVSIPHRPLETLSEYCRQVDNSDTFFHIDLSDLSSLLQSIPSHNLYADCPQCNGNGEVECKCCGELSKCRECDGAGITNTVIGTSRSPAVIDILGLTFDANLIDRMCNTAFALEHPKIGYLPMSRESYGAFFILPQDVIVCILFRRAEKKDKHKYALQISQQ